MVVVPPSAQATWAHSRLTQLGPASGGGGGNPPSGTGGGRRPHRGARARRCRPAPSPQSMALVQLGGAQTPWLLQIAPGAQAWLLEQGFPTGVHRPTMQLLPASQSPERRALREDRALARDAAGAASAVAAQRALRVDAPGATPRSEDAEEKNERFLDEDRGTTSAHDAQSIACFCGRRNPQMPVRCGARRGYFHTLPSCAGMARLDGCECTPRHSRPFSRGPRAPGPPPP